MVFSQDMNRANSAMKSLMKFAISTEIAIRCQHNDKLSAYATSLMKLANKPYPDICLSFPIGGLVTCNYFLQESVYYSPPVIELVAPWPIYDLESLFILAHEVKHIIQYRDDLIPTMNKPEWLIELEADVFAINYFMKAGLHISDSLIRSCKRNISTYINDNELKKYRYQHHPKNFPLNAPDHPVKIPNKELVRLWIANPFLTTEIKNLVD